MKPTLLVGDFILVRKFSYGIKNPINNNIIIRTNLPKRGDVIVFKYPHNLNINYVKRIIGIPGDKIIYDDFNKKIIIKPKYLSKNKLNFNYNYSLPIEYNNIYTNSDFIKKIESLNGIKHFILIKNNQKDKQYRKNYIYEWVLPDKKYFVMGDNRDNSSDSRFWGFVSEENLVGKAIIVLMSINKKAKKLSSKIRINHIGVIC